MLPGDTRSPAPAISGDSYTSCAAADSLVMMMMMMLLSQVCVMPIAGPGRVWSGTYAECQTRKHNLGEARRVNHAASHANWHAAAESAGVTIDATPPPPLGNTTRVSPPRGCHPTPFLPVRPRFSTILCKFAHNFFPFRVSPGAVRPS